MDRQRGLCMDAVNVERRRRYRAAHPRACTNCGVSIKPIGRTKYCWRCASPTRFCAGVDGLPCNEIVGNRRQRCETCGPEQRLLNTRERVRRFREKNRG
jgi:hypothetical protein